MTADAISTAQRNRLALVYIRQSSPRQVVHTLESQRRQRGFASRAAELDWPANRIRVIDEDLGQSGGKFGQPSLSADGGHGGAGPHRYHSCSGSVAAGPQQWRLVPTAGRLCMGAGTLYPQLLLRLFLQPVLS